MVLLTAMTGSVPMLVIVQGTIKVSHKAAFSLSLLQLQIAVPSSFDNSCTCCVGKKQSIPGVPMWVCRQVHESSVWLSHVFTMTRSLLIVPLFYLAVVCCTTIQCTNMVMDSVVVGVLTTLQYGDVFTKSCTISLVSRHHLKNQEKDLVTLLAFVVSAIFVWSRWIMFVHYNYHVKVVDSFQDHFKMGTRLAEFSSTSIFRNLGPFPSYVSLKSHVVMDPSKYQYEYVRTTMKLLDIACR